ncbi:putative solute carrier family 35 member C320,08 [Rhizoctonia solani AG-1 IB]|uniref:Putative solute carrier family 35 member C320,08 n=1 Tax=Thanatephorus cucumeris (strain AG1-IB / isolate 7/3/14) TaxID=1108050 RepID=M5BRQ1_THACB|nr:putative solute carrier family 35 member C320,08 [Rhizoctonia solani AG-1 IB]
MPSASDHLTGTGQYPAASMVKGDLFMLAGATLYGFTNATEEFFVRNRPLYEVIGQLGMYGMIINAIQASGLEHDGMRTANWNGGVIGLLFAYTIAMLILYTTAPLIYRAASSVYYNLSLLSSNFYGLLFALGLYHQRPYWLYFVAFVVIIFGLVSYFWHSTPEEQGKLDPQKPEYVQRTPERDASPQVPV